MKFKSLLLLVGFIPALAMAEVAKPTAPEKPPVVARPVVGVTHVYHHHYYHHYYHHHGMPGMMLPGMMLPGMPLPYMSPQQVQQYYGKQSGPPQIYGPPVRLPDGVIESGGW